MDFIEPCFGIGHNLSLICQMTSEDIKHQLIIIMHFSMAPFRRSSVTTASSSSALPLFIVVSMALAWRADIIGGLVWKSSRYPCIAWSTYAGTSRRRHAGQGGLPLGRDGHAGLVLEGGPLSASPASGKATFSIGKALAIPGAVSKGLPVTGVVVLASTGVSIVALRVTPLEWLSVVAVL